MRATQSSGGTVTSLMLLDNVAAGQGDVGSLGDRRRDARLSGRGLPSEPLRVDIDSPSQPTSFTTCSSCQSRQLTCESSQLKPVSVDIRTASAQDTTLSDESRAFYASEHSEHAGGDCIRPHSESFEDASKLFVVGVKSGVVKGAPKPALVPSIPVAIKTGTKEGKEAKDSKRAGSKK